MDLQRQKLVALARALRRPLLLARQRLASEAAVLAVLPQSVNRAFRAAESAALDAHVALVTGDGTPEDLALAQAWVAPQLASRQARLAAWADRQTAIVQSPDDPAAIVAEDAREARLEAIAKRRAVRAAHAAADTAAWQAMALPQRKRLDRMGTYGPFRRLRVTVPTAPTEAPVFARYGAIAPCHRPASEAVSGPMAFAFGTHRRGWVAAAMGVKPGLPGDPVLTADLDDPRRIAKDATQPWYAGLGKGQPKARLIGNRLVEAAVGNAAGPSGHFTGTRFEPKRGNPAPLVGEGLDW